jgi:predicted nucleic acid-binding protein
MGANDLWIVAHALATGHILVTDDRGFARIAALEYENWLQL